MDKVLRHDANGALLSVDLDLNNPNGKASKYASPVQLVTTIETDIQQTLALLEEVRGCFGVSFEELMETAAWIPMADVAPLKRRPVEIDALGSYPELGVRSFGKGTFQKPPLSGAAVGTK